MQLKHTLIEEKKSIDNSHGVLYIANLLNFKNSVTGNLLLSEVAASCEHMDNLKILFILACKYILGSINWSNAL